MLLTHFTNFRDRNGLNIRLIGVEAGVVLVIVLGGVKLAQRFERSGDRPREGMLLVERTNLGFRGPLLVVVGMENGRAILRANVVPLAVELRRVVSIEKYVEQSVVADLGRIIRNSDRFDMSRIAAAH